MARRQSRPPAITRLTLQPLHDTCWACGGSLWTSYHNFRTVVTLHGPCRLTLRIRRCHNLDCPLYHKPYRPEEEGSLALPQGEFGLDIITLIGSLRYTQHRSVPEIHKQLLARGVSIAERTVTYLMERYEELVALHLADQEWLKARLREQGRVVLAIDGLQPDMGHEVLWVIRDCVSGEILLARPLLSAAHSDLMALLSEVQAVLTSFEESGEGEPIEICGVISDGEQSIRLAVREALPGVPHQLCQFHYLREATRPMYEADRHAKKELKKQVRGVRAIERSVEERLKSEVSLNSSQGSSRPQGSSRGMQRQEDQPTKEANLGYCLAVRSALTEDGPPPLCAPGLKLHERLQAIHTSLEAIRFWGQGRLEH